MRLIILVPVLLLCLSSVAAAAPPGTQPAAAATDDAIGSNPEPPPEQQAGPHIVNFLSQFEFWLSIIVLLFGAFVIVVEYKLLAHTKEKRAEEILRIYAVTLILVGSLFLITAGYDSSHISPISGLFGTVAGYLLGRGSVRDGGTTSRGEE